MDEHVDLIKILKDCPRGWKFWSPVFGEVEFDRHYENKGFFNVRSVEDGTDWSFTYDATFFMGNIESKEIMLYPSRENRDWSKFTAPWYKKEKFDPKTLNPFDKVLGRKDSHIWRVDLFSHHDYKKSYYTVQCVGFGYEYCIPYNDETKHLVGTRDEAPEFYRYWKN